MKRLTKEQVLLLHNALIQETGGSKGLRDEGLLESALRFWPLPPGSSPLTIW